MNGEGRERLLAAFEVINDHFKTLFEALARELRNRGMQVLSHRQVPANDGGLALGQAVIAAASLIPTTLIPSSR